MKKYFSFLIIVSFLWIGAGFSVLITPSAAEAASSVPAIGFEDLAERLLPTVVNISTTTKVESSAQGNMPHLPDFPPGSPFEEFFKNFSDQFQNKKPVERNISSLGSGFVIDAEKGYIVTNHHVVREADEIKVILNDNTKLEAKLVGSDEKTDIALLQVKTDKKLVGNIWGDSDKAKVGSWVMAIGNPFGLGGTVTAGIVSARHRDINAGPYDEFIQTDASINRGNSGGPMFNLAGEVVGVNTAIFSPTGGSVGIGFAVPSNLAKGVIAQLIKYGKTKRGWLGVRIQSVTDEIAESIGLDKSKGAMVSSVTEDGPAAKAGIQAGDVILKFEGDDVDKMRQLPKLVADAPVGKKAELLIWRKGKKKTMYVDLGQLEKAEETGLIESNDKKAPVKAKKSVELSELGLNLLSLNEVLRKKYNIQKEIKGVLIVKVDPNSAAAEKGLMEGDVISEINQKEITTPKQAIQQVAAAKKSGKKSVLLFVARQDDLRFVALKLKK